MRKKIALPALLLVAAVAVWLVAGRTEKDGSEYRFVEVTRGDVESVVSATGILQATTTVQVGTQISGQVSEIYVDFNDRVKANQLIARIDPSLLEQEVRSTEASLARAAAELEHAKSEEARFRDLFDKRAVTETEHAAAKYQLDVAKASRDAAQVSVDRARRNLGYTEIRAPIRGVVLDRQVDVGQTVAASLSAPVLFVIAEDLSEMEILASVDESDIGRIFAGQPVHFTVQAFPDERFDGQVRQARLQSAVQENVVNYTVEIAVKNPDGKLLPGMTATVEFVTGSATDVLRVPNAALRFRATQDMIARLRRERGGERPDGAAPDSGTGRGRAARETGGGRDGTSLWFVDAGGKLGVARVEPGITDGQLTEIRGDGVTEGMRVIAAVTSGAATGAVNPFQSQGPGGFRPPGP